MIANANANKQYNARNIVDDVNVKGARSQAVAVVAQRCSRPARMPKQFGLVARRLVVVIVVIVVIVIVVVIVVSVCRRRRRCIKELCQ